MLFLSFWNILGESQQHLKTAPGRTVGNWQVRVQDRRCSQLCVGHIQAAWLPRQDTSSSNADGTLSKVEDIGSYEELWLYSEFNKYFKTITKNTSDRILILTLICTSTY